MNRSPGLRTRFRLSLLSAAVASCFAAPASLANPVGPQVVNGQVSVAIQGSTLTVTNSPNAIIHWQSFSIDPNETTRFLQQSAASAVLNRVVGQDPSLLLGALQSNGRVFLVNPTGIVIGQGARIDVAGLVASTLEIRDHDFLAGRLNFQAGAVAGDVRNQGAITTTSGGLVYLIGSNVENSGIIRAPDGSVLLAAGRSVRLGDTAAPGVGVEVRADGHSAVNLGQMVVQGGSASIYAGLIEQKGVVSADSVSRDAGGRIVFRATRDVTLAAGSRTSASGPGGGSIIIDAGGTSLAFGTVEARGHAGKGGDIRILGERVGLAGDAVVDVSGISGGGSVLLGGGAGGRDPNVRNAVATFVGVDTAIRADAGLTGDGGSIILWADQALRAYGAISARGGAHAGNGGFVETSSHGSLDIPHAPDLVAPAGSGGSWLIDPSNIYIGIVSNLNVTSGPDFSTTGSPALLDSRLIASALNENVSVTVDTTGPGTAEPGNITLDALISTNGTSPTRSLTLRAHNDIYITPAGGIESTVAALNVTLHSDSDSSGAGGIVLHPGASIDTNGGNLVMGGGSDPTRDAAQASGDSLQGIAIRGATIRTGRGNISMIGHGSSLDNNAPNPSDADGVWIVQGSVIETTTGNISIRGSSMHREGARTVSGVTIFDGGTQVVTASGNITIDGIGPGAVEGIGALSNNEGVAIGGGALVQASFGGTIAITGNAGVASGGGLNGVLISSGGKVIAGGNASVSITGSMGLPGQTGQGNSGVNITGAGSSVQSSDGGIVINGSGSENGVGRFSQAVLITDGAMVQSTGNGTVSISGTAGLAFGLPDGDALSANLSGVVISSSGRVLSSAGAISIVGDGGTLGANARFGSGVYIAGSQTVVSSSAGSITIEGTGPAGARSDVTGVHLDQGALVSTGAHGSIEIRGVGGSGATALTDTYGTLMTAGARVESNAGAISIHGDAGQPSPTLTRSAGIVLFGNGTRVSSQSGDVALAGAGSTGLQPSDGVRLDLGASIDAGLGSIRIQGSAGGGANAFTMGDGGAASRGTRLGSAAASGDITITSEGGAVVLEGETRTAGTIAVESTAGARQSNGSIKTSGLLLSGSGDFVFDQPGNAVEALAAQITDGSLTFANGGTFTVGSVREVGGIFLSQFQGDSSLQASLRSVGGSIELAGDISVAGDVTLRAANGATQQSGAIQAAGLLLLGSGSYVLDGPENTVGTLAADIVDGSLRYSNADSLIVGSVGDVAGIRVVNQSGAIAPDVRVVASSTLEIAEAVYSLGLEGANGDAAEVAGSSGTAGGDGRHAGSIELTAASEGSLLVRALVQSRGGDGGFGGNGANGARGADGAETVAPTAGGAGGAGGRGGNAGNGGDIVLTGYRVDVQADVVARGGDGGSGGTGGIGGRGGDASIGSRFRGGDGGAGGDSAGGNSGNAGNITIRSANGGIVASASVTARPGDVGFAQAGAGGAGGIGDPAATPPSSPDPFFPAGRTGAAGVASFGTSGSIGTLLLSVDNPGDLSLLSGELSASVIRLDALSGRIEQDSGASIVTDSLFTRSSDGTALAGEFNSLSFFSAENTGVGDIALNTSGAALTLGSVSNQASEGGSARFSNTFVFLGNSVVDLAGDLIVTVGALEAYFGTSTVNAARVQTERLIISQQFGSSPPTVLTGHAAIEVSSDMQWYGGTLAGTGTLTTGAGASTGLHRTQGDAVLAGERTWDNYGIAAMLGAGTGNLLLSAGTQLNNFGTLQLDSTAIATSTSAAVLGPGRIVNSGTIAALGDTDQLIFASVQNDTGSIGVRSGTLSMTHLVLTGGRIDNTVAGIESGGGVLQITQLLDWSGGTIASAAEVLIADSARMTATGAPILDGLQRNTSPDATFTDLSLSGVGALSNTGTLRLGGSVGIATQFSNGGTIDVAGGNPGYTLTIADGARFENTGLIRLPGPTMLEVSSGTLVNQGTIEVPTGASATLRSALDNRQTVMLNGDLILSRDGATHTNTGSIVLAGGNLMVAQAGGSFDQNAGSISIAPERVLTFVNPVFNYNGGTIDNRGTLSLFFTAVGGTAALVNSGRIVASGVSFIGAGFENEGQLELRDIVTVNGSFGNSGTIALATDASTYTLNVANGFSNSGRVDLRGGTISVANGAMENSGTIELPEGSSGTLSARLVNSGQIVTDGLLRVGMEGAAHVNTGTIQVRGGDLVLEQAGGSFTQLDGNISIGNGRSMSVAGPAFVWQGGSITGASAGGSRLDTGPGGLTVTGAGTKSIADLTVLAHALTIDSGRLDIAANGILTTAGPTAIAPKATLALLDGGSFNAGGDIDVDGLLSLSGGILDQPGGALNNRGLVDLATGQLELTGGGAGGGVYQVGSGALLRFGSGDYSVGSIRGPGGVEILESAVQVMNAYTIPGTTTVRTGGTLALDGPSQLGTLLMRGGTLAGLGSVTTTVLDLTDGVCAGEGDLMVTGNFIGTTNRIGPDYSNVLLTRANGDFLVDSLFAFDSVSLIASNGALIVNGALDAQEVALKGSSVTVQGFGGPAQLALEEGPVPVGESFGSVFAYGNLSVTTAGAFEVLGGVLFAGNAINIDAGSVTIRAGVLSARLDPTVVNINTPGTVSVIGGNGTTALIEGDAINIAAGSVVVQGGAGSFPFGSSYAAIVALNGDLHIVTPASGSVQLLAGNNANADGALVASGAVNIASGSCVGCSLLSFNPLPSTPSEFGIYASSVTLPGGVGGTAGNPLAPDNSIIQATILAQSATSDLDLFGGGSNEQSNQRRRSVAACPVR